MTIESKNPNKYINILLWVLFTALLTALFFILKSKSSINLSEFLIVCGVCLIYVTFLFAKFEMFYFRKIEFDESGCTVKFLFIKKKYTWEKLKIKRIEKYESQYSMYHYGKGTKAVVFSPTRVLKPKSLLPVAFIILPFSNPFTYIFINLTGKDNAPLSAGYYEYDEDTFMKKMKEWNIEFEERTIKKGWKPPALG